MGITLVVAQILIMLGFCRFVYVVFMMTHEMDKYDLWHALSPFDKWVVTGTVLIAIGLVAFGLFLVAFS